VLDFINADYTFVMNGWPTLRNPCVKANSSSASRLKDAAWLHFDSCQHLDLIESNRTSPVKRGKWVLENCSEPAATAAAGCPELKDEKVLAGTLRERMDNTGDPIAPCAISDGPDRFGFETSTHRAWREKDGNAIMILRRNWSRRELQRPAELRPILLKQKRADPSGACRKRCSLRAWPGLNITIGAQSTKFQRPGEKRTIAFSAWSRRVVKSTLSNAGGRTRIVRWREVRCYVLTLVSSLRLMRMTQTMKMGMDRPPVSISTRPKARAEQVGRRP